MSSKERFKLIPAVYLILRKGSKVLLLQRANSGYQDGNYSLISGHLDGDELAKDALIREAAEEAGITILSENLTFRHVAHRLNRDDGPNVERMDLFFEATEWEGEVTNKEPHKCGDLSWYEIDELPHNMIPLVRQVLNHVANGVSYSEYITEPQQ